jgi:iron complex outermembrane receptor protein
MSYDINPITQTAETAAPRRVTRGSRHSVLWAGFAACLLLAPARGSAQSIDYGASEQLFGEPVTTSVTGSPQRASEVPATVEIITADEIRRSGSRDIPNVLRHIAGIDVLRWHNDDADVAVRGYNQVYSPRLLVLIDGRQVYADYYGYTPWTALPVELGEIRQIEVVKGPNSALFGFNAVGGVINIVTYNPLYDRVSSASLGVGTQTSAEGSAIATLKLGRSGNGGVRISAGARSNDDFSTPESPVDVGTRRGDQRQEINLRAVERLGRNVVSEFEATASSSEGPELSTGYITNYTRHDTKSAKLQVSAETRAGLIAATAYSNWITLQADNPKNVGYSSVHVENQVTVAQLQDIFKGGGSHTFRLSAEYRHNTMPTITGGAQISYDVASAAGMWDWKIRPSLSMTNAVRLDHLSLGRRGPSPVGYGLVNADWNGRSLSETSFNTGLVWRADARDTFRLTAARGIQVPSLLEFGGLLIPLPNGFFVGGIPTLNPGIVTNYELAWDRTLRGGALLRVSAYHETARDIVALQAGNDFTAGLAVTPANIGGSEATGLEFSLKGNFNKDWRWNASYTPEIIKDDFGPGFTVATTGANFAKTTPVHVVNAGLGYAHGPWEADTYLRYESTFYGIQKPDVLANNGEVLTLIPDYVSVDARVGYKLNDRLTFSLSGQNLTSSPQRQTAAPDVQRRVFGTLNLKF